MGRALIVLCVCGVALTCKPVAPPCSADLSLDSLNCGECGNVCAPGSRCDDGRCVTTCAGLKCAGELCVDPMTDPLNCGACGVVCRPVHSVGACLAGACSHGPCEAGWFDCDGDAAAGCESSDAQCIVDVCGSRASGVPRDCYPFGLSADGRRVLFASSEDDYVPGDEMFSRDAFLLEVPTGQYRRVLSVGAFEAVQFGALSGDGTRAFLTTTAGSPVTLDLETGQAVPVPPFPMRDPMDASFFFDEPQPVSLSHSGQRMIRGPAHSENGLFGFVVDLPSGPTRVVESLEWLTISGNGNVVGVVLSEDGGLGAGEPWVVDLDGGEPRLLIRRQPTAGPSGGYTSSPALSFDGTIAAFYTGRFGYEGPGDDAGLAHRIIVVGRDGGATRVLYGLAPSLSYDGRRLAYMRTSLFGPSSCVVIDVESNAVLVDSRNMMGSFSDVCSPTLSGDGRSMLVVTGQPNPLEVVLHVP